MNAKKKTLASGLLGAVLLAAAPAAAQQDTPKPASFIERGLKSSTVHGYITSDFQGGRLINDASQKNKITPNFELYRFIFGMQAELAEGIVFNSEVEIEHATRVGVKTSSTTVNTPTGTTSALTKASAGLEIELEQAWVEFKKRSWLRPRVGVMLVPVGRLNLYHDSDLVDSVDRPLSDQHIIGTTWFEPGIGVAGDLEFGDSMLVSYQAVVINGLRGSAAKAGAEGSLRDLRMHKDSANDNNTDKGVAARLSISPWQGLEVAASGYRGAYDPASSLYITYGSLDGQWRWRWVELQGEWVEMNTDLPDQARVQAGQIAPGDAGYFLKSDPVATPFASVRSGWWAQLKFRVPVEGFGRFEPFVQVGQLDPNREIVTSMDQNRTTWGLNWRPSDNVVVKMNYADTAYVQAYTNAAGGKSPVVDQRLQASLAASY